MVQSVLQATGLVSVIQDGKVRTALSESAVMDFTARSATKFAIAKQRALNCKFEVSS